MKVTAKALINLTPLLHLCSHLLTEDASQEKALPAISSDKPIASALPAISSDKPIASNTIVSDDTPPSLSVDISGYNKDIFTPKIFDTENIT